MVKGHCQSEGAGWDEELGALSPISGSASWSFSETIFTSIKLRLGLYYLAGIARTPSMYKASGQHLKDKPVPAFGYVQLGGK